MKKNKSGKTLKQSLAIIILVLFFGFSPIAKVPKAHAWMAMAAAAYEHALDMLAKIRDGIILSTAKKKALLAINQELNFAISGSSSGNAMFIVNWRSYLIDQPKEEAGKYLNDYLSQVTRDRGSLSGYISAKNFKLGANLLGKNYEGVGPGSFAFGMAGNDPAYANFIEKADAAGINLDLQSGARNYVAQLVEGAKKATIDNAGPQITYFKGPGSVLDNGTFRDLEKYADSKAINTPEPFADNAAAVFEKEEQVQEKIASNKAQAGGGFTGKEENGMTLTPGKVVEGIYTKAQTMYMDIIANANHLPEIIATALINKAIDTGIGTVQASAHKEIQGVRNNVSNQVNNAVKEIGPSALYNNK